MAKEYLFKDKECPSCKLPLPSYRTVAVVKGGKGMCPRCKKYCDVVPAKTEPKSEEPK